MPPDTRPGDEHVPGPAGVLPDEEPATRTRQAAGDRSAERVREGGLQVDVRDAPDAVRAEEAAHAPSPAPSPPSTSATVTRTRSGVTRCAATPSGSRSTGATSCVPTSRSPTGTSTTRPAASSRVERLDGAPEDDAHRRVLEPIRLVRARAGERGADLDGAGALVGRDLDADTMTDGSPLDA